MPLQIVVPYEGRRALHAAVRSMFECVEPLVCAERVEAMEGLGTAQNEAGVDGGTEIWRRRSGRRPRPLVAYVDAAEDAQHLHKPGEFLQGLHPTLPRSWG